MGESGISQRIGSGSTDDVRRPVRVVVNATTVDFTEEAVRAYLDEVIRYWRKIRDADHGCAAEIYIDAFQSVRISLFGEALEGEVDG